MSGMVAARKAVIYLAAMPAAVEKIGTRLSMRLMGKPAAE